MGNTKNQTNIVVHDSVSCFAHTAYATIHVNYKPTMNAGNDKVVALNNSFTVSPDATERRSQLKQRI